MAKMKTITGVCIPWAEVLAFLDTLPPWQELCTQVEERCKILTDGNRKLMAVAVGVCSHNYAFPENVHEFLRMVNAGQARPFRWHGQVGPRRWIAINTVIVAIQGWLEGKSAVSLSRTWGLKQKDLGLYLDLIGPEQSHIKRAMLRRLLWNIIDNAVRNTGLGIIGDCKEVPKDESTYVDFSKAYKWDDRTSYLDLRPENDPLRSLDAEITAFGQSGTAFLTYLKAPTQPFCQQKLVRYQQVALHRVSMKWTDPTARPPGGIPRSDFENMFQIYTDGIARWYEDLRMPTDERREIFAKVSSLLGERTECKRAIIDCLISRSKPAQDLQEAAYTWLKDHTRRADK